MKRMILPFLAAAVVVGCGAASDSKKVASYLVEAQKPSDSTGAKGKASVTFVAGLNASGAALTGETSVDLGNGIVVESALLNIGAIKIKAEKEENKQEKALEKKFEEQEKERELDSESAKDAAEAAVEAEKKAAEDAIQAAEEAGDAARVEELKQAWETREQELETQKDSAEAAREKAKEEAELAKEAKNDKTMKWYGSFLYDAIANALSGVLPDVSLWDGTYRRIKVKLSPDRVSEAGSPILNNSVYISGAFTTTDGVKKFSFAYDHNLEMEFKGTSGVKINPTADNKIVIAFDMQKWFTGVDLSLATVDADGKIVLDQANNTALMEKVRRNIKRFAMVGTDDNGDGQLSHEEEDCDGSEAADAEEAETGGSDEVESGETEG